jgi:hypothetical protein
MHEFDVMSSKTTPVEVEANTLPLASHKRNHEALPAV